MLDDTRRPLERLLLRRGRQSEVAAGGGKVEYASDAARQQKAIFEPGVDPPTRLERDKDGRLTKTTYPNRVSIERRYDGTVAGATGEDAVGRYG